MDFAYEVMTGSKKEFDSGSANKLTPTGMRNWTRLKLSWNSRSTLGGLNHEIRGDLVGQQGAECVQ